jgi:hypothetical protein
MQLKTAITYLGDVVGLFPSIVPGIGTIRVIHCELMLSQRVSENRENRSQSGLSAANREINAIEMKRVIGKKRGMYLLLAILIG